MSKLKTCVQVRNENKLTVSQYMEIINGIAVKRCEISK